MPRCPQITYTGVSRYWVRQVKISPADWRLYHSLWNSHFIVQIRIIVLSCHDFGWASIGSRCFCEEKESNRHPKLKVKDPINSSLVDTISILASSSACFCFIAGSILELHTKNHRLQKPATSFFFFLRFPRSHPVTASYFTHIILINIYTTNIQKLNCSGRCNIICPGFHSLIVSPKSHFM